VKKLLWSMIVSCHCWAQTGAPTPGQINGRLLDDLSGDGFVHGCNLENGQRRVVCTMDHPNTIVPPEKPRQGPIGQTISVRQLRHKIPKDAARDFQRAIKLSRAGEHQKAVAELEAAMRLDPELYSAADRMGAEYIYLGRWDKAEMAFRRTTDLEPSWWMGHYNLALALYRRGDLGGAEKSMRRALLLSSENAMIHLALGAMLVKREETRAEGITELRLAAPTMADARQALRDLGTR
jgi:tetratricopeptide (TPR) repeat protein